MLAGRLRGMGRRAELEPTYVPPSTRSCTRSRRARHRRQPRRDLRAPDRLRARAVRGDLDVPGPEHPLLPRAQTALPPCLAERRLARVNPSGAGAPDPLRPLRRCPDRLRLRRARRCGLLAASRSAPASCSGRSGSCSGAGIVPLLPIIGLRMAGIDAQLGRDPAAGPDRAADRRRLPADRHRPLEDRSRRLRQRLGRRRGPLGRRAAAQRRAAFEPRRLGRAHRRRGVARRGDARLRPRPPPRARPRAHPVRQRRLGLLRHGPLPDQRGGDDQLPDGPPSWSSSARRSRPPSRARRAARPLRSPLHTDALPAAVRGFRAISIIGLEDGLRPPCTTPTRTSRTRVDAAAMAQATEFVVALARLLDRDAGARTG